MKIVNIIVYLLFVTTLCAQIAPVDTVKVDIKDGEYWWAGVIDDGYQMPFAGQTSYRHNFLGNNKANQIQPLLLSNRGRYIWSEEPFEFVIDADEITLIHPSDIRIGDSGNTLREAYLYASEHFFPPSGDIPAPLFFTHPQYNTWIELTYDHNQRDILAYAQGIVDNGFPTGVFMIDDTWQNDYGDWTFKADRFTDPHAMISQLKSMGFKVMVWVCPFVSADSPNFRALNASGGLLQTRNGTPAIVEWWNGYSAVLDFTHPKGREWFRGELSRLQNEYEIDGFKFDGGDANFYTGDIVSYSPTDANGHTEAWARFGLDYSYNEYRACWKLGGHALAQRLHDKHHNWDDLQQLIPNSLLQGLSGYAFTCPDMIGGGEYKSFLNLSTMDQELVVRSAQCQALMPMMQFSVAPWRILSAEHLEICQAAADLHVQFGDLFLELARQAAQTGEPIVRHLEYEFPEHDYETLTDQFMVGEKILVAPVLQQGARERVVTFPPGTWQDEQGVAYEGPADINVSAPLDVLPWFRLLD